MKIITNSIYTTTLMSIFLSTPLNSTDAYKSIHHEVQELEHECLIKVKKFEKELQQIFNHFHSQSKLQPYSEKDEEIELHFVTDKSHHKLPDKQSIQDQVESGKSKLQDTAESSKQIAEKVVKSGKDKVVDMAEKAKDKTGKFIDAAQEKTRDSIQAGKEKIQEVTQPSIPPQDIQAKKMHDKFETGKKTIHDKLVTGKDKITHNLQQAKQKVSNGLAKGKNKLEKNIAAAAYNLQLHTHNHTAPIYNSYEQSNTSFEFNNIDRCIKIKEEKSPYSTKYVIQDTHKTKKRSTQQKYSNLTCFKNLRKYIKKNYNSKIANIILTECITDVKNRRNKNHIDVIISNKDFEEKYFIEVTPKKSLQLFKHKKRSKKPASTLTYAHNPTQIL